MGFAKVFRGFSSWSMLWMRVYFNRLNQILFSRLALLFWWSMVFDCLKEVNKVDGLEIVIIENFLYWSELNFYFYTPLIASFWIFCWIVYDGFLGFFFLLGILHALCFFGSCWVIQTFFWNILVFICNRDSYHLLDDIRVDVDYRSKKTMMYLPLAEHLQLVSIILILWTIRLGRVNSFTISKSNIFQFNTDIFMASWYYSCHVYSF